MPLKSFPFGQQTIGEGAPCFIIAEVGINHEGSIDEALKMAKACADAGANAVKLQTSDPDENYHPASVSYEIYKKSFLGPAETDTIFKYGRSLGLEMFTTSGLRTLEWVEKLKPSGYKLSSGLFSHFHLTEETIKKGRPVILSTGLSSYEDIDKLIPIFRKHKREDYAILQCTSLYPCPDEHIHLAAIQGIANRYGVVSGLSDHTTAIDVPALAAAAGAKIIEKHFSLDTKREGFDHAISLDYEGFKEMVRLIRRAETLLGNAEKRLIPAIQDKRKNMERFIFSAQNLTSGHTITINDLLFLRAQEANSALVSAVEYEFLLGKRLKRNINHLEPVTKDNVEA